MKKKSWIVTVDCRVTKEIITKPCTEEEAESSPFDFAVDEAEIEQLDWDVISVRENN